METAFKLPASLTRPKKGKKAEDKLWQFCVDYSPNKKAANELYYVLEPYTYNYMRVDTSMRAAWDKFGKDETSPTWLAGVTAPRNAAIEEIIAKIAEYESCDKHLALAIWAWKFPQNLDYLVCAKLSHDDAAISWFINHNSDAYEGAIRSHAVRLAEEEHECNADECSMPVSAEDMCIISAALEFKATSHAAAIKAAFDNAKNSDIVVHESTDHLFITPKGVPTETWLRLLYSKLVNVGLVDY